MNAIVNWCKITADAAYPYLHHKADGKYPLMYDPDLVILPDIKAKYMACPSFGSVQQYLIKSPFYGKVNFDPFLGVDVSNSPHLASVIKGPEENLMDLNNPYFQLQVPYLFWSDSECYLWVHDIPEMYNSEYRNWYIIKGMIPIHKIYRPVHPAIVMKNKNETFKIDRGDPLFGVTLFSPEGKIKLVEKEPDESILVKMISSTKASSFCPYKWSKELFGKWFNGVK